MVGREPRPRPRPAARRFGYLLAVAVNLLMYYLVNVSPGWQAVPFLDEDFTLVLGLLNLSLLANAVANVAYIAYDPPWFKAAWDVGLALIAVWLGVRMLEVFPVSFAALSYDLTDVARIVLVVALVGSVIALVIAVVTFAREVFRAAGGAGTMPAPGQVRSPRR